MKITSIDHVVLTVKSIEKSIEFYGKVLGLEVNTFGDNRKAILVGKQKINFHLSGKEFEPKAQQPTPGSMDFCFISETPLKEIINQLKMHKIAVVEGPVEKTGALGKMMSVYIRDPDLNLVEISNYQ